MSNENKSPIEKTPLDFSTTLYRLPPRGCQAHQQSARSCGGEENERLKNRGQTVTYGCVSYPTLERAFRSRGCKRVNTYSDGNPRGRSEHASSPPALVKLLPLRHEPTQEAAARARGSGTGPALTGVIDQGCGSKVGCWCEAVTK